MRTHSTILKYWTATDKRAATGTQIAVQAIGVAFFALATGWGVLKGASALFLVRLSNPWTSRFFKPRTL